MYAPTAVGIELKTKRMKIFENFIYLSSNDLKTPIIDRKTKVPKKNIEAIAKIIVNRNF
jgi:hypothetical protein